jgi:hypothetical protein
LDDPQERLEMDVSYVAGLATGEGHFGIAVRKNRPSYRLNIALLPAFSMDMNDKDVVEAVSAFLKQERIPHWVFRHKTKPLRGIRIHGMRRLAVFIPWILPHMIGTKHEAAQNVLDYIRYRFSLPHQAPYTERDLNFVRISRSLNGWQGLHRTADIEEISRILRDCTPSSGPSQINPNQMKIQSELV